MSAADLSSSVLDDTAHPTPGIIVMLVPGGRDHAGGIGRWAGYLQDSWTKQGLSPELRIIDTRGSGNLWGAAVAFASALLRILWLHCWGRLGVVHANLSTRGSTARKLIVASLVHALGIPFVVHLHGSGYDRFFAALPAFWQRQVARMFRRADSVVVLGQSWADWVQRATGVPAERVTVLHNGVPRSARRPREAGPCRILLLGRLGARKGVPELIAALGSSSMRARTWTATLAGDGEVARFRQEVSDAGLADRVALPGWLDVSQAAAQLARADIMVLPSHAENFPISIIEALAAGVAVVATPVGATPELLRDQHSALFVPVGDADALADALARLIDDPGLRADIGAAGHGVFARELDIDMLARRLAGLHASFDPSLEPQPAC